MRILNKFSRPCDAPVIRLSYFWPHNVQSFPFFDGFVSTRNPHCLQSTSILGLTPSTTEKISSRYKIKIFLSGNLVNHHDPGQINRTTVKALEIPQFVHFIHLIQ